MAEHTEGYIIKKYCKDIIFIETGSCFGRTIEFVLNNGAKEVRSIEGMKDRYEMCLEKFKNNSNVKLWHGDSRFKLKEMIKDINEKCLFFLDAHPSGENSFGHKEIMNNNYSFGQNNILLTELKIISEHDIKNHTIIIDDQHLDDENQKNYKNILLEINKNYSFILEKKLNIEGYCLICVVK